MNVIRHLRIDLWWFTPELRESAETTWALKPASWKKMTHKNYTIYTHTLSLSLSLSLPPSPSTLSLPYLSRQFLYLYHFDDISWSQDSWIKLHVTSTSCQGNHSFLHPLVAEQCPLNQVNTWRTRHPFNLWWKRNINCICRKWGDLYSIPVHYLHVACSYHHNSPGFYKAPHIHTVYMYMYIL